MTLRWCAYCKRLTLHCVFHGKHFTSYVCTAHEPEINRNDGQERNEGNESASAAKAGQ